MALDPPQRKSPHKQAVQVAVAKDAKEMLKYDKT